MRRAALALVCVLVLVSGCSALTSGDATTTAMDDETTVETTTATFTTTTASSGTATETTGDATTAPDTTVADAAQEDMTNASGATGGDTTPESGDTDTAGATSETDDTASGTDTIAAGSDTTGTNTARAADLADPPSDTLGWEGGYWYNESLSVSSGDGLNASERAATVNRTMARLEVIRELEFTESVPVNVVTREEFQQSGGVGGGGDPSSAFRAFDNAKFEALFMIGEDEDSLAVQQSNRNQSVAGYYSPGDDSIVVVSPSDTPRLTRSTLAHELVHALQDQQFDLSSAAPQTRDAYNARNGVVEGEANYIQRRYEDRCGEEWKCLETPSNEATNASNATTTGLNYGVYFLQFFPYSDGPGFVDAIYEERGWAGVNALHEDLPASAEQVIYPERYDTDPPTNVSIEDSTAEGWSRVRPDGRPDYATLGQSGLSSMFGYTGYDQYNGSSVVERLEFLNVGLGGVNTSDPVNYGLNVTEGWDGDRMHVYRNDADETGYVWKLAWDSPEEAEEFVAGYERLLAHWGGERTGNGTWTVAEDSPFADAFSVRQEGDTVTIVNGPTAESLDAIH